jgi:hypothetical protein
MPIYVGAILIFYIEFCAIYIAHNTIFIKILYVSCVIVQYILHNTIFLIVVNYMYHCIIVQYLYSLYLFILKIACLNIIYIDY